MRLTAAQLLHHHRRLVLLRREARAVRVRTRRGRERVGVVVQVSCHRDADLCCRVGFELVDLYFDTRYSMRVEDLVNLSEL